MIASYRDPRATWLGSPNYWSGRPGGISWIVLHTMVGTVASANARFQIPSQAASAHYGVGEDGSLVQWVDEANSAWHAGDGVVNQASIGIEHEDMGNYDSPRPDALYARSSALVAAICSRYGIPVQRGNYAARVAGCIDHRTVYATACPDALDTDRIIAGAHALYSGGGSTIGEVLDKTDPVVVDILNRLDVIQEGAGPSSGHGFKSGEAILAAVAAVKSGAVTVDNTSVLAVLADLKAQITRMENALKGA